jgi:ethanolamine utilization protein EutA
LLAFDGAGRVQRIDASAELAAREAGVRVALGQVAPQEAIDRIVAALAEAAIGFIRGASPGALAQALRLTEPLSDEVAPRAVLFSGGVAEYLEGRESRDFGDIAQALARRIRDALDSGRIGLERLPAREGIRATVIGASQFTVQVSGKTIHVSGNASLPLHNVPVVAPVLDLDADVDASRVAQATLTALQHATIEDDAPVALAIHWRGEPLYARIRALAEGIALALAPRGAAPSPAIVVLDGDVARTLGHILEHELRIGRPVVAIDGVQLRDFDFIDVGEVIRPADVVPVVIKSLLFPASAAARPPAPLRYQPVNPRRKIA